VIAADGTPLSAKLEPRLATLPFVVGPGAAAKARDFLAILDKHPRSATRCAPRSWWGSGAGDLRLKIGIDVRLPGERHRGR
jgi:cell division protein FtsQ